MTETITKPSETFACSVQGCKTTLKTKNGINNHIQKHQQPENVIVTTQAQPAVVEDNLGNGEENDLEKENEVMEEWKDIFDVLDKVGEVYDTSEKKTEADELKKKLDRIRDVVQRKADIIKEMREKIDMLEAGGSRCHECTLKDEVAKHKEALIDKKEKETIDVKKQLDNQRKVVNKMKKNYEKAIEDNNKFKEKVDEQQEDINHLQEQCGIDDDEDVQEEEVHEEEVQEEDVQEVELARNPMNKNKSGHLCVTCDQRFVSNNGLENHIMNTHTNLCCDYCGKLFPNKRTVEKHMDHCEVLGLEAVECNKCNKVSNTKESDIL